MDAGKSRPEIVYVPVGPWVRDVPPKKRPLWSAEDWVRWALFVAGGLVLWLVGWYLASGEINYSRQIGPANLAVAGLLVAGAGHVWCLMRGRRAIGERRRRLLGDPALAPAGREAATPAAPHADGTACRPSETVAGDGMMRYHRRGCPLAAGRDWPVLPAEEQEAAGRIPCGACRP
jgi:hypothetical protein